MGPSSYDGFPHTTKSVSKALTLSREEGPGRAPSIESMAAPSSAFVLINDYEDNVGYQIEMHGFQLSNYISETIWCVMRQILDCNNPLRNIDDAHVTELCESFLTKEFD